MIRLPTIPSQPQDILVHDDKPVEMLSTPEMPSLPSFQRLELLGLILTTLRLKLIFSVSASPSYIPSGNFKKSEEFLREVKQEFYNLQRKILLSPTDSSYSNFETSGSMPPTIHLPEEKGILLIVFLLRGIIFHEFVNARLEH